MYSRLAAILSRGPEVTLSRPVLGVLVADETPQREDILVARKAGHVASWVCLFIFIDNELIFII